MPLVSLLVLPISLWDPKSVPWDPKSAPWSGAWHRQTEYQPATLQHPAASAGTPEGFTLGNITGLFEKKKNCPYYTANNIGNQDQANFCKRPWSKLISNFYAWWKAAMEGAPTQGDLWHSTEANVLALLMKKHLPPFSHKALWTESLPWQLPFRPTTPRRCRPLQPVCSVLRILHILLLTVCTILYKLFGYSL